VAASRRETAAALCVERLPYNPCVTNPADTAVRRLWSSHPRRWRDFHYVYPVISRRARGLSIGVNLNPDKVCNWDCAYCQVDRSSPGVRKDVDLAQLRDELDWMLGWCAAGAVWDDENFREVPTELRRINDIAFSGDGEPTTCPQFEQAAQLAVELKKAHAMPAVKVVTLTNMTMAHRDNVRRAFAMLDQNNGEIWAKLDAGTEPYYKLVDRSSIPFGKVLANIEAAAQVRPLVIQSLLMKVHGEPMPDAEFEAYLGQIQRILNGGGAIKLVQLYTIARQTAENFVQPLTREQLDAKVLRFRERLPGVAVEAYYGVE
jgi:wyosine [tRNA(Phe)-imidazoG37] synthetase (radical SAM superfamily)